MDRRRPRSTTPRPRRGRTATRSVRRTARRRPRRRPRTCTVPSSQAAVAAIGGRLGPRRTTSSRENTTRTARPVLVGELACRVGRPATSTLPPNAPPFASGVAGSPPGSHHDASGSRYAGSTQLVASRTPPGSAPGSGERRRARRRWSAGPAPCPRAARASSSDSATTQSHARGRRRVGGGRARCGAGTATSASRGARSSANPPSPQGHVGADPGRAAFELGPLRRGAERTGRVRVAGAAVDRLVDRLPAGAPAQVRGERAVDVDPAGLALGLGGRDAHEDPRRAEAALRAAGRDEARGEPVADGGVEAVDRGDRPPGDPGRPG